MTVLELSTTSALVISEGVLKPDQRVRVALRVDGQVLRIAARVAAAKFEAATRSGAGFYWSRLVGGARPLGGVSLAFAGAGSFRSFFGLSVGARE